MGRISFNRKSDLVPITGSKVIENVGYFETNIRDKIIDYLKTTGYDVDEIDLNNEVDGNKIKVMAKYQTMLELNENVLILNHFIIAFDGEKTDRKAEDGKFFYFGKVKMTMNIWLEFDWKKEKERGWLYNFLYTKIYWPFFKDKLLNESIGAGLGHRAVMFNIIKDNVFD